MKRDLESFEEFILACIDAYKSDPPHARIPEFA